MIEVKNHLGYHLTLSNLYFPDRQHDMCNIVKLKIEYAHGLLFNYNILIYIIPIYISVNIHQSTLYNLLLKFDFVIVLS